MELENGKDDAIAAGYAIASAPEKTSKAEATTPEPKVEGESKKRKKHHDGETAEERAERKKRKKEKKEKKSKKAAEEDSE